ncbi:MAG: aminotransferase class V-fold PLP-dependent enzyme [Caldisericia bacterium]
MPVYLNNNSSTFPKVPSVQAAVSAYLKDTGVVNSTGESNSFTKEASLKIRDARNGLAKLLSVHSDDIYFAPNVSFARDKIIGELLAAGDRMVVSSGDELANSNLINHTSGRGVDIVKIPVDKRYSLKVPQLLRVNDVKVLAVSHVNSVTGIRLPIPRIAAHCKEKKTILICDLSDSIGSMPIDIAELGADIAFFSTHKHLFGVGGIAGIYINPSLRGKFKHLDWMDFYSTENILGIVSLAAGVDFVLAENPERIKNHIKGLRTVLQGVLEMCRRVEIITPPGSASSSILSFTVNKHMPNTIAGMLEERFGIVVGHGMFGNPACKSIKLHPEGIIRVGLGFLNTVSDVEYLGTSVDRITSEK